MASHSRERKSFGAPSRVRMDGASAAPDEERMRARVKQNTAYEKYKASLHAFFDGDKPLPENLREMLSTRPGAEDHGIEKAEVEAEAEAPTKAKKKAKGTRDKGEETPKRARRIASRAGSDLPGLMAAIRKASSPREVETAVDALLAAGHSLPADGEVLSKALGHSNDDVIEQSLRGLLDLAETADLPSPRLLRTRVENVALLASSREVSSLCEELKDLLS